VKRFEVPYVRNANGEWRADFSTLSPTPKVRIDPKLEKIRGTHFRAANLKLAKRFKKNPSLVRRLNLSKEVLANVKAGERYSPTPYTWDHANGNGDMVLIDSDIHGLFLHQGGFFEWN